MKRINEAKQALKKTETRFQYGCLNESELERARNIYRALSRRGFTDITVKINGEGGEVQSLGLQERHG